MTFSRKFIVVCLLVGIMLYSSCATFETQKITEEESRQLTGFEISPNYLLSFDRICLFREADTSRNGKDTYKTNNDSTIYSELVCSIGNNLYVDLWGNIFFDVVGLNESSSDNVQVTSKKWSYDKKEDQVIVSDNNIFTEDRVYKIYNDEIYSSIKGEQKKYIEKTAGGYTKNIYSVFGEITATEYIESISAEEVIIFSSKLLNASVKKISDNQVSIVSMAFVQAGMLELIPTTIDLIIINENTIQIDVSQGFRNKSYELVYGKDRIVMGEINKKDVMQIDIGKNRVNVRRVILDSSLIMILFGTDKETIEYSIQ